MTDTTPTLLLGDCAERMRVLADSSIDSIMTEKDMLQRLYIVSRNGDIFRRADNHKMAQGLDHKGYERIRLTLPRFAHSKDGRKTYKVHRLVAMFHLPDYSDDLQVNHINGNKSDNRVDNLEIATPSENARHAWRVLDSSKRRAELQNRNHEAGRQVIVKAVCANSGTIIAEYHGIAEAAKAWSVTYKTMHKRIRRGRQILNRPCRTSGNDFRNSNIYFIAEKKEG